MPSCEAVANRLWRGAEKTSKPIAPVYVAAYSERRLPHLYEIGQPLFLTWRLSGSLPRSRWFAPVFTSGEAFAAMDQLLDRAQHGPRYLTIPEIAEMVTDAVCNRDRQHYDLHAFVVMSNHVHLLFTPMVDVPKIMHSLKRYTAFGANRILGRTGQPFWQDESYDRFVRDRAEFDRIKHYIENNPVKAGLVSAPPDFVWSSARRDWQSCRRLATCPTSGLEVSTH